MHQPFVTTRWSLIARAGEWTSGTTGNDDARAAFADLIAAYWQPLYAFARTQGRSRSDAEDLVQGFFARAVEKGGLVPRERRARFRSFLLAAFQHFCANEHERDTAHKRGGGGLVLGLECLGDHSEREEVQRSEWATPEQAFERRYAQRVLERCLERLREEQARVGKAEPFAKLAPHLTGADEESSQASLASELGSSVGAVKVALHRLRRRYGEILRDEIAGTLDDPAEVDAELAALRAALGK